MIATVVLSFAAALAPHDGALQAARETALRNALRGMTLPAPAAAPRQEIVIVEPPARCAIRLMEVPADPGIDPKMVKRVKPGFPYDRMPLYRGLPPCPRDR